ncbi:MAG: NUDIX hydrolase [Myxococcota bacterium]|jgi:8-oxo-dGTP pyrophosphatase MutT (NUDIX family)
MSQNPPRWTLVGERSTKDFRIFRTRTLDVADPRDGKRYVRTVIEAPDWCNVLPLTRAGQVVLIRQFRFGTWSNELEIPGGMLDAGEDPAVAAARELEEETGYRPSRLEPLGVCSPNPAIFSNRLHTFVAFDCEQIHAGRQDASEDIRVELVPRAELKRLVREGAITHALVLAALLYDSWR